MMPYLVFRKRSTSVHPQTLNFWNRWINSDFWGREARRFRVSCGCIPLQSETPLTAGAHNASGTHHPRHYIRSVCAARDRLRTKGDVAMAGRPAPADQLGLCDAALLMEGDVGNAAG